MSISEGLLKMVIMSATVDVDRFSQYWRCPVLYVPGRQFPFNIRHVCETTEVHRYGVSDRSRLEVVPLYAAEPVEQQQQVFKRMKGDPSQGELVHI